jgi:hypothetical protein
MVIFNDNIVDRIYWDKLYCSIKYEHYVWNSIMLNSMLSTFTIYFEHFYMRHYKTIGKPGLPIEVQFNLERISIFHIPRGHSKWVWSSGKSPPKSWLSATSGQTPL